jgi:hypothetical protein
MSIQKLWLGLLFCSVLFGCIKTAPSGLPARP